MASPQAYARPGDDVAPSATWSVTSGAAATGYPASNVGNRNPAKPFKATGTSATLRATFGSAQVLVGVVLVNHNLAGAGAVSIASGSGLSQPVPIAANSGGQCTNAVLDFSSASLGQRTSTTFDVAVSGGVLGNVAIGEIVLLTAIRDLTWIWGVTTRPKRLVKRQQTFGGTHLLYNKRVRVYTFSGQTDLQSEEAAMRVLEEEAQGEVLPWVLWPDRAVNQAHYVQFAPGTFAWTHQSFGFTDIPIEAEELSMGPPLFP